MPRSNDVDALQLELARLRDENRSLHRLLAADVAHAGAAQRAEAAAAAAAASQVPSTQQDTLTIVVMGASGDLAKKKTYPAMFELFKGGFLPARICIVGYARSSKSDEQFRAHIRDKLSGTDQQKQQFLQLCFYFVGQYDQPTSYSQLLSYLQQREADIADGTGAANRLFYYAVPPTLFLPISEGIKGGAMSTSGWNRIVVEKPFGHDTCSAAQLGKRLSTFFREDQIYRIDHYLGKEMVQNLMTVRFANSIFEPLWNKNHISLVTITFKEDIGTQGRGGYFDKSGIIRDVMQNHLIQILSLVAMEPPISGNAEDIRDEKVKVLRCIDPLTLERLVLGQYVADKDGKHESYRDDPSVPDDSITPTFALATVFIKNQRWNGVPFILKCGKALGERKAEIRIQFKKPDASIYSNLSSNELVLRVQPKEAIYAKFMGKKPGLDNELAVTELDLTYHRRFQTDKLPDAYERLILDVIKGDRNSFVRNDEVLAAWEVFTPVLHRIETEKIQPQPYHFGSRGPAQADLMAAHMGLQRTPSYRYPANL